MAREPVHGEVEERVAGQQLLEELGVPVVLHDDVGSDPALGVHGAPGVRVKDGAIGRRVGRSIAGFGAGDGVGIARVHVREQVAVVPLDPAAGRGVVARGRQREARAVGERVDALDEALAPRALAHDQPAVVVLDGPGHDFGSRRRAAIDQNDEGLVEVGAVARGEVLLRRGSGPALCVDDHRALRDEDVGDVHSLFEDAARIAPQVEQELLHTLFRELFDGLVELLARGVREVGEHDVAHARLEHEGVAHRFRRDLGPRDRHGNGLGEAHPPDRDRDRGALGAAELADDILGGDVLLELLGADVRDDVAGADSHPVGRGALHRSDDRDLAHPFLDLDAEPVEGPVLLFLHRRELVGLEERRVRIEPGEHPVDRGVDDLVRGYRLGRPIGEGRQNVRVLVERGGLALRGGVELAGEDAAGEGRPADQRKRE